MINNKAHSRVDSRSAAPKRTLLSLSLTAALLTACGGTGQDDGSPSTVEQEFSGAVLDGYLARATVFIDSNNNGTRDAWEAYAFTDNEGFYSFNPNTNTDYCADTASAQEKQYCLVSNISHTNVVVRVDGGYDVLTGEPFLGQLTRRVDASNDQGAPTDSLISPITSLLTSALTEEQTAAMLNALGLQPADLDTDYLNSDGNGTVDANLLNKALTIHKAVTVLADRLNDTYDEIGDNFGTPNDASAAVYDALAESVASIGTLDGALQPAALYEILDQAEEELKAVYNRKDLSLPADMGDAQNPQSFQRIAEIVSDIPPVVDALFDATGTAPVNNVAGRARALESLVLKAVNESDNNDSTIENAVEFFTSNDNEPLIGALIDSLDSDTADLGSLSTNDFSGTDFDSVLEIAASSSIPENSRPITRVGGTTLRLSDLFLGSAPNKLDDNEVEFYFDGQPGDTDGSFTACVKVIEDANEDGTLGDGNTRGDVADGFWSMLPGPGGDSTTTYNLVMTINFLGATYQGIVKAGGLETREGVEYQAMRFDNDGKLETWYTQSGFVEGGTAPADAADCEARLPSRVGI
jgi:hypothetical protein